MSFDNIQLPASLLADLYKDSIVQLDDVEKRVLTEQSTASVKFLGENKKGILILVEDKTAPFLNEISFRFLLNILTACKLNMADVALINKTNLKIPLIQAINELTVKTILIFGIESREMNLPIDFPHYQVQKHGNLSYLTSDDFETLEADKQRKGKLWLCLKKIFDL
ncbi:MAG: hypothetical protein ACM3H8_07040 [Sphingobacteriales bacterium]